MPETAWVVVAGVLKFFALATDQLPALNTPVGLLNMLMCSSAAKIFPERPNRVFQALNQASSSYTSMRRVQSVLG